MNNKENILPAEKRLSLDLPEAHHAMLEEISRTLGFSSKTEVVRNALQFYYEAMTFVQEGYEAAFYNRKNHTYAPYWGNGLITLRKRQDLQDGGHPSGAPNSASPRQRVA
jgi:hypothetical protein